MERAAIYARFSTDLQNEKSTEDQIDLCSKFAAKGGFAVIAIFEDKAKSGASIHGREGLQDLLRQAQQGRFNVIIVEALDRLSRDMEDLAAIFKRLNFNGVKLIPADDGREATTMTIGLRGLVGQLYREDNVLKIRRGMSGLVRDGLSAGGKVYGYQADPVNKGRLLIVEEEAQIVRRIFQEYADGKSPKSICRDLHSEGIRPPRGRWWSPSALNGLEDRQAGLLRNSTYVGKRTWNKVTMVKDPSTGKRVSRANDPGDWQTSIIPELRLISDELWETVQAQLQARSRVGASRSRRPKRFLSGVLACGACGSGMSTSGKDKSGRVRLRCSAHSNSGSCTNPRTYYLERVESLVLDSLAYHLDEPDLIEEYFRAYEEERRRLAADKGRKRIELEKKLSALDGELERLVDFIAKGISTDFTGIGKRMDAVGDEKKAIMSDLLSCEDPEENVMLHPTAIREMAKSITHIRDLLRSGDIDGNDPAAHMIREVLEKVTVIHEPESPQGFVIKVDGKLGAFTRPARFSDEGVCVKVVAEEGLEPPTRGL